MDGSKRQLGLGGPELSKLGFGSWASGGPSKYGWSGTDDQSSIEAIRLAVEAGINWVDTAAFYGLGHSERIVAEALQPWKDRDEVYIFTKCGLRVPDGKGDSDPTNNLRPESIRFECEQSLRRLGVERIDLYQFHWPDRLGTPIEDSWGTMLELIDEGKVRWGGVSNFGVDLLDRCEAFGHVQSLQPRINLFDRSALDATLPWCRQNSTGVLAYSPLASGLLTGTWDADRVAGLPAGDWRKYAGDFAPPEIHERLALVERLKSVAAQAGTTLTVLATAWVLSLDGVTGAIVGARNTDHVNGWLPAAGFDLGPDIVAEIDRILAES